MQITPTLTLNMPGLLMLVGLIISFQCPGLGQSTPSIVSPRDTAVANQYLQLADSLNNQLQTDKAIELVTQAKKIYESAKIWEEYVSCHNLLARYYDNKSETEKSADYLKKAERLGKQYLPSNSIIRANTFQQKAELFIQQDQQDSALVYLAKAGDIFRDQKDWEGTAWINILMVVSYYYQSDFHKMDSLLQVVYQLDEAQHFDPETEIRETVFQWQLILYDETGDYGKTLQLAKQAVEERQSRLNTAFDSSMLASNYHNLATIYQTKGDYDEAIRYFDLALDIQMKIAASPEIIFQEYKHLGKCFYEKNEPSNAIQYFRKGLEQLHQSPEKNLENAYIEAFTSLGRSFIENEQLDSAIIYLDKALVLSNQASYEKDLVYLNLGLAYKGKKEYKNAIRFFEKAIEFNTAKYGERHPLQANLYQYLGEVYDKMGKTFRALDAFQKALSILDKGFKLLDYFDNPPIGNVDDKLRFLRILRSKANTLLALPDQKNQLEKTYSTFQLAATLIDNIRRDYESEGAKQLLSEQGHSIYEKAIKVALLMYDHSGKEAFLKDAFTYSEKSKALLLLESIKDLEFTKTYNNPAFDALEQEFKNLKLELIFYERKLFEEQQKEKPNALKMKNWEAELASLRSTYESQRYRLEKEFPDYYQLHFDAEISTVETIQQFLSTKPNTAFIEYFMGNSILFTFVVTVADFKVYQLPLSSEFKQAIKLYLTLQSVNPALESTKAADLLFTQYTESAYYLYQQLLKSPLENKDFDQLIIVPDGNLSYLSFDALLTAKATTSPINYSASHLQYLLEDYQLSYAYSATLLFNSLRPRNKEALKNYGGFAPVFKKDNNQVAAERACDENQLGTLEHSEESVREALALFGGQIFLNQEASKNNFQQHAADFRILHLSTHACLDDNDPMFNTIYFADAPLHTYELYNLQLKAELTVLSACETGVGKLSRGEGVFSLARGFMQAGCPAVVTSLWNANDYSTTQIMMDFHKNLYKGQTKDEALRQAKLAYLESSPSRLSPPYYWATFVGIGDMEAVKLSEDWTYWWLGGGALLLLFVVLFFIKK